jgi:hypothetical protein
MSIACYADAVYDYLDLRVYDPALTFTLMRPIQRSVIETNCSSLGLSKITEGYLDSMMMHVAVLLLLLFVGHEKTKCAYDFPFFAFRSPRG